MHLLDMSRVCLLDCPDYGGLVHEVRAVTSQQVPHLPADSGHHSVNINCEYIYKL